MTRYTQEYIWQGFKGKPTTDGGYRGTVKFTEAQRRHWDMRFEETIVEINKRLKARKTKVTIKSEGGGIQLIATLPLKPGDTHRQGRAKKQYKISLGIPANFEGLETAEEEAYELGKLIARQTFIWTDKYLGVRATKEKGITFDEFYEQFEKRYFETRKRTIRSENTFFKNKAKYKTYFMGEEVISAKSLKNKITSLSHLNDNISVIALANVIKKILKIEVDFTDIRLKAKSKKRNIPRDNEIEFYLNSFQNKYSKMKKNNPKHKENWRIYKSVYALIAIYGLRPREVINNPDLGWLLSPENKFNTFRVHESNKTGFREVFPFVPEWINLFDLKNPEDISKLQDFSSSWKTIRQLQWRMDSIFMHFKEAEICFSAYDLRHACAIRAHLQGIPIKAAADNLGHSVEIHTKVYQQWFGLENRRKAFSQAFEEASENEKLKDENVQLKKRIAELELELERYRLESRV